MQNIVLVEKGHVASARKRKATIASRRDATVGVRFHADTSICGGLFVQYRQSLVNAAVVERDKLPIAARLFTHASDGLAQKALPVVHGQDYGEERLHLANDTTILRPLRKYGTANENSFLPSCGRYWWRNLAVYRNPK